MVGYLSIVSDFLILLFNYLQAGARCLCMFSQSCFNRHSYSNVDFIFFKLIFFKIKICQKSNH